MTKRKFSGPFLPFPRWALAYLGEDSIAKVVLLTVLLYMDADTQELTTSHNHIAKLTGYSRSTIIRAVNRLISTGVLIRKHRVGKNVYLSNRYIVNFNNPAVITPTLVSPLTLGVVSPLTLCSVTPDTRGSVTPDTRGSVTPDTQSRITNNKNNINKNLSFKKGKKTNADTEGYEIDPALLEHS